VLISVCQLAVAPCYVHTGEGPPHRRR
jgi:hypothetical protein